MLRATVIEVTDTHVHVSYNSESFVLPRALFLEIPLKNTSILLQSVPVSENETLEPSSARSLLNELLAS